MGGAFLAADDGRRREVLAAVVDALERHRGPNGIEVPAAVRIAVEMVHENLISKEEAVLRVKPADVDTLLHPQFDPKAKKQATSEGKRLAKGVNASPGAAVGKIVFTADEAVVQAKNAPVILVRAETTSKYVPGTLAKQARIALRVGKVTSLIFRRISALRSSRFSRS